MFNDIKSLSDKIDRFIAAETQVFLSLGIWSKVTIELKSLFETSSRLAFDRASIWKTHQYRNYIKTDLNLDLIKPIEPSFKTDGDLANNHFALLTALSELYNSALKGLEFHNALSHIRQIKINLAELQFLNELSRSVVDERIIATKSSASLSFSPEILLKWPWSGVNPAIL
jgi:hypothetical protein